MKWSVSGGSAASARGCTPCNRVVALQSSEAFRNGLDQAPEWKDPETAAWGLRVPRAVGDRLMFARSAIQEVAPSPWTRQQIEDAAARLRREEGIDAGPEGGAAMLGYEALLAAGQIAKDETAVVFNTGGDKYR